MFRLCSFTFLMLALSCSRLSAEQERPVIELWPAGAPNEPATIGEEHDSTKESDELIAGKRLIRLANVSNPTITVYSPPADKNTGAAVLVCPGGAYHILALDLEGTEVCEWLNSIGVTGILLKYRVPRREGREPHAAPLEDAQRAMGLVRSKAKDWDIDPKRIGVLGFSAGGHLAAALSTNFEKRAYTAVDEADETSCRPDFTVLVYPGYLVDKKTNEVRPEVVPTKDTLSMFLVMTQDDSVGIENVLNYSVALHKAGVSTEVHVYPEGGHGYGLRRTELPVTTWPDRVADWMKNRGWLAASSDQK